MESVDSASSTRDMRVEKEGYGLSTLLALWVTVFVYWLSDKRSDQGAFQYSQYNDYNDYYQTKRVDRPYPSFSTRMSRVLEALSTDSMDLVLDTVRPTISRMESGVCV
jgi:hypothetical protein